MSLARAATRRGSVRPEVGRELSAETGQRGPRDVCASEAGDCLPPAGHDENHPSPAAARHVSCDAGGDVKVGGERFRYRLHELLEAHVEDGAALDVVVGGRVEADVDAALGGDDVCRVALEGGVVEHVHLGDVGCAAGRSDRFGDALEAVDGAPGKMDVGSIARLRARDRRSD